MSAQAQVAVIVVSWNSEAWLEKCLSSLMAQSRRPDRVIAIDNASSDGSVDSVSDFGLAIELIKLDHNTGFAVANNIGIAMASDCEWVALLNPDATAEPDWLRHLLDAAAINPTCVSFASRMLCSHNLSRFDGAGDVYHFTGLAWRRGHGHSADGHYLRPEGVFSACAGAALYRRDALMEIGGFDEAFFCYMEDVDLGFRLQLRGHRCLYVPSAVVHHVGSGTTGKHSDVSVYYGHRNVVWTFFKDMPLALLIAFLFPHLLMNIAVVVLFALRGKGRLILKAKWAAIKGLGPVLRQRSEIANNRRSSTRNVAAMLSFWPYK